MHGDDRPTREDVEARKAWTELGSSDALGGARADTAYGEGSMFVPGPEPAREVEEAAARALEGRHQEGRAGLMRAVRGALARGHAVGPGPWAMRNWATEEGRENLRRAGFEERHDGEPGTVWVRPADGKTLPGSGLGEGGRA